MVTVATLSVAVPHTALSETSFDVYGQLNFALFNTDDGEETATYFTDNDNSNTRVGFNWVNQISADRSLRFNFETAVGLNGSSAVTINDTALEFDFPKTELRKFEFIYKTPSAGTFSAGQGSDAADGNTEADFSGTSVIAYTGIADLAGGIEFRNPGGGFSGVVLGDAFKSFDGGRNFRVRYDTPSWNGLVVSASGGVDILDDDDDSEYYSLAARYSADYGDIKADARIGYEWVTENDDKLVGSVAALHKPSGLSLALAAGENRDADAQFIYAKLGYRRDWFDFGETALSVDINYGDDFAIDGSDSSSYSVAAVQMIDAYNVEIYAIYRKHEFDSSGVSYKDVDVVAAGFRWKF